MRSTPTTGYSLLTAIMLFTDLVQAQPGTLDASFGTGGETLISVGTLYDQMWDMAIQADDKIVVVGHIGAQGAGTFEDAVILRFNADGSVDDGFGNNGQVIWTGDGVYDRARAVDIDTDGRIVVAGETEDTNGEIHMFVMRLLADGSFDTSFSGDGVLVRAGAAQIDGTYSRDVACLPDGSILVAGYMHWNFNTPFHNETSIWKCTSTGGTAWVSGWDLYQDDLSDAANGVVVRDNGSIVLGTSTEYGTDQRMGVMLFNSDGSLPLGNYQNVFDFTTGDDYATSIVLMPDGRVVLAGKAGPQAGLVAVMPNTGSDPGFGTAGEVVLQLGSWSTSINGALLQPWDKILVTGGFSIGSGSASTTYLGRYLADGTLDATFGNAGIATHQPGVTGGGWGYAIGLQSDGRIIMGGSFNTGGNFDMFLVRFNNDIATGLPTAAATSFSASPNPTSGALTLSFATDGAHSVLLIDGQGRVVRSEGVSGTTATMDLHELPTGLYILREVGGASGVRVVRE